MISPGRVTLIRRHEVVSEAGELVEPALVFHAVVGGNFDLNARGHEGDELADGDADHAEAEARAFVTNVLLDGGSRGLGQCLGRRLWQQGQGRGLGGRRLGNSGAGGGLLNDGLVVVVVGHLRIVDRARDVVEDIQRHLRGDVEELALGAYAQVCQSVDGLVDEFFNRGILLRLDRRVDFKGQRHGGVVQLFGADVHGAGAFADFNPVFAEAGVREDVDVACFVAGHGGVMLGCPAGIWRRCLYLNPRSGRCQTDRTGDPRRVAASCAREPRRGRRNGGSEERAKRPRSLPCALLPSLLRMRRKGKGYKCQRLPRINACGNEPPQSPGCKEGSELKTDIL